MANKLIFISYARPDLAFARTLSDALRERGCESWLDRDEIKAGDDWVQEIEHAMNRSDLIALLISSEYLDTRFSNYERGVALKIAERSAGSKIVPILVPGTPWEAVPPSLRSRQVIKADDSIEKVAEYIAKAVGAIH